MGLRRVLLLSAIEAVDRLGLARDVERNAIAEVEIGRRIDRPADAHRTAEDVRHAFEGIVAHESQRALALLVEHTIAREIAEKVVIVRTIEDEAAVVDDIAGKIGRAAYRERVCQDL